MRVATANIVGRRLLNDQYSLRARREGHRSYREARPDRVFQPGGLFRAQNGRFAF